MKWNENKLQASCRRSPQNANANPPKPLLSANAANLATATDEKLRIYSLILKEQTDEIKERKHMLSYEPRYRILDRFVDRIYQIFNPERSKSHLSAEAQRLREMIAILEQGGTPAQKLLHQFADAHARANTGR